MGYNESVSVVMPVHNGERYLREAIESVLNQTYTNFEFLLIENCSNNSSVEIIKSYTDPRIRLIIEEECGQVQAYNRGFKEAKGEYISIHDQDDICAPTRFAEQLNNIELTKADICGSFINIIDENDKIIGNQKLPTDDKSIKDQLIYKNFTIFNSSVCIRKKVLHDLSYFKPLYFPSADYEFYLKASKKYKFSNVPLYLYNWRIHSDQISNKFRTEINKRSLELSMNFLNSIDSQDDTSNSSFQKGLIYYYNNSLIKSFYYCMLAIYQGFRSKKLFRYLTIIIFFGVPLKAIRSNKLIYSKLFLTSQKYFDSFFRIEDKY